MRQTRTQPVTRERGREGGRESGDARPRHERDGEGVPRASETGARAGEGCPVEEIAQAYLATTQGDAAIALRCAITDALSDLLEAERHARRNSRLISRGYVRAAMSEA